LLLSFQVETWERSIMAEMLENFSKALADAVEAASVGTVRVEARRRLPATGIVWSADGIIVTAHHVVERDENINIGLPDGSTTSATLVGRDPNTDLAVLRVQNKGLTLLAQANTSELRVGNLVLALGRPGTDILSTIGIVSALGDGWRTPAGGQLDRYVQTDVTMYPGFSGGPLIDVAGNLIGMNTSALRDVSLAVPIPTMTRVVESLLKHGKVRQGYLGVGSQPVRLPKALAQELGQETGLVILSVEPDSPADKGGLLLGDTLVAFEGKALRHLDDLMGQLGSAAVGKTVTLRIVRGGQLQDVKVTVGERE
jgi:S1-C subfamily serine protease